MELQKPKSLRNSTGGNVIDHKKRKREEKEGRKEGGAGNFDFELASRFLSKSKPPEIHLLAQTSTIIQTNKKLQIRPIQGYLRKGMNHSFHSIYNIIGVSIFLATQSSAAFGTYKSFYKHTFASTELAALLTRHRGKSRRKGAAAPSNL